MLRVIKPSRQVRLQSGCPELRLLLPQPEGIAVVSRELPVVLEGTRLSRREQLVETQLCQTAVIVASSRRQVVLG